MSKMRDVNQPPNDLHWIPDSVANIWHNNGNPYPRAACSALGNEPSHHLSLLRCGLVRHGHAYRPRADGLLLPCPGRPGQRARAGRLMNCPAARHTHSIADVCELIGCESQDWLIGRVRNGTFPGRGCRDCESFPPFRGGRLDGVPARNIHPSQPDWRMQCSTF